MRTNSSNFMLSDFKLDGYGDTMRNTICNQVRKYRKYRKMLNLPQLKVDASYDHYHVETKWAKVYLCPVYKAVPSIDCTRREMKWRASIEFIHPASRWHPEEADELELCDSNDLIIAVHCASAILRSDEINNILSGEALAAHHAERGW